MPYKKYSLPSTKETSASDAAEENKAPSQPERIL
jgi:hypothetical protein